MLLFFRGSFLKSIFLSGSLPVFLSIFGTQTTLFLTWLGKTEELWSNSVIILCSSDKNLFSFGIVLGYI